MPVKKAKPKAKAGKAVKSAYACEVCGATAVIDPVCGCAEEHVFICCGEPMKKAAAKKPAAKKAVRK
ncbi:MAG TPA: hypothetical protein VHP61_06830 [Acidobacteriota bacterium]|nr:hypothetical protein [Acidobacteriota bacterium]